MIPFYKFALRVVILLLCLFSIPTVGGAKEPPSSKYDIESAEVGKQGTYLIKVYVYTKKGGASIEDFKYAAVHGVIFRGFSGKGYSSQKPLASADSETEHKDFYSSFFGDGKHLAYAEVVTPSCDRVKISKKEYKVGAIVSVSKDELRKALEAAGVVRSLNSGF